MTSNPLKKISFWSGFSPWILIGAAALLLPIFSYITFETIQRQQESSFRLLLEKGAALIRAFEAGTRTGLMDNSFSAIQLQRLLSETAMQKDIVYLLVVDTNGIIVAHSDPSQIGKHYGRDLNLKKIVASRKLNYRTVKGVDRYNYFEVIHQFAPINDMPTALSNALTLFRQLYRRHVSNWKNIKPSQFVIFIGLDMTAVEEAGKADAQHAIITGMLFLLIGFTGIVLLFFTHNYRVTRSSLSKIKAFSDNIVENIPIGLIALDNHKRIASFNHVAESLFPLLTENSLKKDVADVLPRTLWTLIEHPDIQTGLVEKEILCPLNDNQMIPMDVSSTLLYDEDQFFLGFIFLFKDLSEIQALRKEIERNQRLAAVGRLAAGLAHEIRNPLSSLKGFATHLKEKYAGSAQDQKIADIMIQEVDRLNRVVSQLLEFAKPMNISPQWTDIVKLINDNLKLVTSQAKTRHISLKTDFSSAISKAYLDPDKIKQLVLNLLLNAIEAIHQEGAITVRLKPQGTPQGICISISDTGPGIKTDDRPHIFDPFFTTKNTGTGLGLAIVHNIVEAHKGNITVDSSPGRGTQIRVLLPGHEEAATNELDPQSDE